MRDWIIVISSEKGYRLLSYVCPQRKYYKCNGLTGRQKSLSRSDFSFRSSLKHRNTDPRNIFVTWLWGCLKVCNRLNNCTYCQCPLATIKRKRHPSPFSEKVVRGATTVQTNQKAAFRSRGTNGPISVQQKVMWPVNQIFMSKHLSSDVIGVMTCCKSVSRYCVAL